MNKNEKSLLLLSSVWEDKQQTTKQKTRESQTVLTAMREIKKDDEM